MAYEYLKKLFGKTEEGQPASMTFEQLEEKIGADKNISIVNLKDGGYISEEKFKAKETELSEVTKQLKEAGAEIQSYKDMNVEEIKKSAEEWKIKYETDTKALSEQMTAQERKHQTDLFLKNYKFSSKAAESGIRSDFEKKEFKLEGDKFLGAEDFMKSLIGNDDYKAAFVIEEKKPDTGSEIEQIPPADPAKPLPQFAAGINGGMGSGAKADPFGFNFSGVRAKPDSK